MSDIKLAMDRNYFGFNYYLNTMECVKEDAKELKALLSYKSESMIKENKIRALSDIKCAIDNLTELKEAIEKMEV